ncbi:hypothetical protein TrST_g5547 [Triparma strigata]|uniref:Uncharacterized protein n=1 Tax=Triparma strigata TaxID=1606541 RepID=A0A9W7BMR9_9STRA|nr:hypothetical protein TrST_g5547 [Triparma strigata]|mmetsp:Transcript_542/g.976  ORF Transcript_542/g.976 Transcript_542/m.976 type:complete len:94 (+) Transcript_542:101-382(+)
MSSPPPPSKPAPRLFTLERSPVSPESAELARDLQKEQKKKFTPDRYAETTEVLNYGNGEKEVYKPWKTCMTEYGDFGKTPPPRKPFKPPKSTL